MDASNLGHSTPSVNQKSNLPVEPSEIREMFLKSAPPGSMIEFCVRAGFPFIPEEGTFPTCVYAACLLRSEKTVRKWINQYRIPHWAPGSEKLIDAKEFKANLPRGSFDEEEEEPDSPPEPETKRGSKKRGK
jgi:hypothetical protein